MILLALFLDRSVQDQPTQIGVGYSRCLYHSCVVYQFRMLAPMLPSGFTMRLADVTDRAAVIGLSSAEYQESDCLPELYNGWILNSNMRSYVLEHNGKLVSDTDFGQGGLRPLKLNG